MPLCWGERRISGSTCRTAWLSGCLGLVSRDTGPGEDNQVQRTLRTAEAAPSPPPVEASACPAPGTGFALVSAWAWAPASPHPTCSALRWAWCWHIPLSDSGVKSVGGGNGNWLDPISYKTLKVEKEIRARPPARAGLTPPDWLRCTRPNNSKEPSLEDLRDAARISSQLTTFY